MLPLPTTCGFAHYTKLICGKKYRLKDGLLGYLHHFYSNQTGGTKCITAPPKNRGTGAGGAKTNVNGKTFEQKTENESRLVSLYDFERKIIPNCRGKFNYYLQGEKGKKTIIYVTQHAAKAFFKYKYNKTIYRLPDEAYLIDTGEGTLIFKILEKKTQHTSGSVDIKLLAGQALKEEWGYCLGPSFNIQYAFCLSPFLKKIYVNEKKGKSMFQRKYLKDNNIEVLFGDDDDYYGNLDKWIGLI